MKLDLASKALFAWVLGAAAVVAVAQGGASAPGAGPGPGPRAAAGAASGPGTGPMGMQGGGMMRGWQMNRDNTPGWAMMTRSERAAHRDKVLAMSTYEECKAYMDQHHAQMVERAKERGRTPPTPAAPRHDPCARLKK